MHLKLKPSCHLSFLSSSEHRNRWNEDQNIMSHLIKHKRVSGEISHHIQTQSVLRIFKSGLFLISSFFTVWCCCCVFSLESRRSISAQTWSSLAVLSRVVIIWRCLLACQWFTHGRNIQNSHTTLTQFTQSTILPSRTRMSLMYTWDYCKWW